MALLGRTNTLTINRFVDFGAFLEGGELGEILLPKRYVPRGAGEGDSVEVFVYRDSEDRLIAATTRPFAEVGDCANLEVVQVNNVGAFLNWGLEKDLFVPYAEQRRPMKVGSRYVVYLYIDNTGRIAATTKLRKHLPATSKDYVVGDPVNLFVVGRTPLGWEVAIDDAVLGMVYESDALTKLRPGMRLSGYLKERRTDGRLNVSLQPPEPDRDDLADRIIANLQARGGTSDLTDKSSPDEIFAAYRVSKRAYKAALGSLYKQRLIRIESDHIALTPGEESR